MSDPVSRETPPPPVEAAGVFRAALPTIQRYAEILSTTGIERGLIGPREAPRLWDRHLLNCGLLAQAFPGPGEVADLGSGAGLPGLVLAITRPDLTVVLVEPLLRRSTFLAEVASELELANVEVVRARAEELHGRRAFARVTARAVARLDKLAAWALPLVRAPGELVAMKGSSVEEEISEARGTVRRLGGEVVGVEQYGAGVVPTVTTAVRIHVPVPPAGAAGSRRTKQPERQRRRGTGSR